MIQLPSIFASGALYQQNACLRIRGTADSPVHVELQRQDESVFFAADADTDQNGCFSCAVSTPPASLDAWRILLWEQSVPASVVILEDILFGELWLAAGQSNMELGNKHICNCEEYLTSASGMPLRIYHQNVLCNSPFQESHLSLEMPIEPTDTLNGSWVCAEDEMALESSAAGTAFICKIYQLYREKGMEIPVGFVNANMGATRIESWLPLKDITSVTGEGIDPKIWNTFGGGNFNQFTAMYNLKIYPLRGLQFKGILWYQGESNVNSADCEIRYKKLLQSYYRTYRELFAADEQFHMVMSLLFPYSYGESGECRITCINKALFETARDCPECFTAVTNYDLPPVWGYQPFMHPIHPTNKYSVGERMAEAYLQRATAPTLREIRQDGSRLLLTFDNLGGEITIRGQRLYGLYLRGEHTEYIEAEGECIDHDTLAVWHPFLTEPKHVAYQCASMSCDGNLYGRYLPVAPFATENPWFMHIEGKPWLHTQKATGWFCNCPADTPMDGFLDFFTHPVWQPVGESEVCTDTVFSQKEASLRISGETNRFGAYTKERRYNQLDLQHYSALHFRLFNAEAVSEGTGYVHAELLFVPTSRKPYVMTIPAVRVSDIDRGWADFCISFGDLPSDAIERLTLTFDVGKCPYHFVNIDSLVLEAKNMDK